MCIWVRNIETAFNLSIYIMVFIFLTLIFKSHGPNVHQSGRNPGHKFLVIQYSLFGCVHLQRPFSLNTFTWLVNYLFPPLLNEISLILFRFFFFFFFLIDVVVMSDSPFDLPPVFAGVAASSTETCTHIRIGFLPCESSLFYVFL